MAPHLAFDFFLFLSFAIRQGFMLLRLVSNVPEKPKNNLEVLILLPLPSKCWDHVCAPLVHFIQSFILSGAWCILGKHSISGVTSPPPRGLCSLLVPDRQSHVGSVLLSVSAEGTLL